MGLRERGRIVAPFSLSFSSRPFSFRLQYRPSFLPSSHSRMHAASLGTRQESPRWHSFHSSPPPETLRKCISRDGVCALALIPLHVHIFARSHLHSICQVNQAWFDSSRLLLPSFKRMCIQFNSLVSLRPFADTCTTSRCSCSP